MPSMLLLDIIYAQEGVWVLMNIGDCFGLINIFKELTNKSSMFVLELKKALLKH